MTEGIPGPATLYDPSASYVWLTLVASVVFGRMNKWPEMAGKGLDIDEPNDEKWTAR